MIKRHDFFLVAESIEVQDEGYGVGEVLVLRGDVDEDFDAAAEDYIVRVPMLSLSEYDLFILKRLHTELLGEIIDLVSIQVLLQKLHVLPGISYTQKVGNSVCTFTCLMISLQ